GGIYGTVSEVKDKSVMVEIAPKTVVEFTRMSIHNVIRDDDDSSKDSKDKQQS
ncbi:MAG: preprotein translocase subunit YajC, partial [Lentisphaerae bacterium]